MQRPRSSRDSAQLQPLLEGGADTATIALTLAGTWRAVSASLAPIIGSSGVAALYKRSVYLTIPAHPALSTLYDRIRGANGAGTSDQLLLTAALEEADLAQAAAAGDALLQTFCDLLVSLVGPTLADRLLDRVWSHSSSELPVQDLAP